MMYVKSSWGTRKWKRDMPGLAGSPFSSVRKAAPVCCILAFRGSYDGEIRLEKDESDARIRMGYALNG